MPNLTIHKQTFKSCLLQLVTIKGVKWKVNREMYMYSTMCVNDNPDIYLKISHQNLNFQRLKFCKNICC